MIASQGALQFRGCLVPCDHVADRSAVGTHACGWVTLRHQLLLHSRICVEDAAGLKAATKEPRKVTIVNKIPLLALFTLLSMMAIPCCIDEDRGRAPYSTPTSMPRHTAHTSRALADAAPKGVPSTLPSGGAIHLPLVLARLSASPSVPTPTATLTASDNPTLTPTVTTPAASATPTSTATATSTPIQTPSPTPTPIALVIGHITDAHIGLAWLESQRLPLVVSTLSQQAQVMVDSGDCTEHGTAQECAEYVNLVSSSASIPWRAVMGPRDTPDTFEGNIGPPEWSWDVGGYRLIGINTEAINYGALDQALTMEKPCIIVGHFPLDHCSPVDQDRLRQRFLTYKVPIYMAGHAHLNSLQTDPYSGTLLLTGQRTVRCHYRLISLRGYQVESIEFELACQ